MYTGRYNGNKIISHPFVKAFHDGLKESGISNEIFENMKQNCVDDFVQQNIEALPMTAYARNERVQKFKVDGRSFIDAFHAQGQQIANLSTQIHEMKQVIKQQNEALNDIRRMLQNNVTNDQNKKTPNDSTLAVDNGSHEFENQDLFEGIIRVLQEKQGDVKHFATAWYNNGGIDDINDLYQNSSMKKKTHIQTLFSKFKSSMETLEMAMENGPPEKRPSSIDERLQIWDPKLEKVIDDAVTKVDAFLKNQNESNGTNQRRRRSKNDDKVSISALVKNKKKLNAHFKI